MTRYHRISNMKRGDLDMSDDEMREGFISGIMKSIFSPVEKVFSGIAKGITDVIDGIDDMIQDFIQIICFFKTVPRRFRNLESGFDNIFNGIEKEFTALGFAFQLGFDSITDMVAYIAEFVNSYIKCGVKFASNFIGCIPFYILDIVGFALYLPVQILLWILYTFLSIDLYKTEDDIWNSIGGLNSFFFSLTGFHFRHYPKSIREDCYMCKRLKTEAVARQAEETDRVFSEVIPCQFDAATAQIKKGARQINEVFAYPRARDPSQVS